MHFPDFICWILNPRPGVHNIFAIAGRITFIYMNYGLQFVDISIFCIASVLLPHACLAIFLLILLIQ